jgi:hypothetical protein
MTPGYAAEIRIADQRDEALIGHSAGRCSVIYEVVLGLSRSAPIFVRTIAPIRALTEQGRPSGR